MYGRILDQQMATTKSFMFFALAPNSLKSDLATEGKIGSTTKSCSGQHFGHLKSLDSGFTLHLG